MKNEPPIQGAGPRAIRVCRRWTSAGASLIMAIVCVCLAMIPGRDVPFLPVRLTGHELGLSAILDLMAALGFATLSVLLLRDQDRTDQRL
jgi:hypothetical protein